jgi:hypothetical protein
MVCRASTFAGAAFRGAEGENGAHRPHDRLRHAACWSAASLRARFLRAVAANLYLIPAACAADRDDRSPRLPVTRLHASIGWRAPHERIALKP